MTIAIIIKPFELREDVISMKMQRLKKMALYATKVTLTVITK